MLIDFRANCCNIYINPWEWVLSKRPVLTIPVISHKNVGTMPMRSHKQNPTLSGQSMSGGTGNVSLSVCSWKK